MLSPNSSNGQKPEPTGPARGFKVVAKTNGASHIIFMAEAEHCHSILPGDVVADEHGRLQRVVDTGHKGFAYWLVQPAQIANPVRAKAQAQAIADYDMERRDHEETMADFVAGTRQ